MDEGIPIRGSLVIPAHELTWRFSRSGGPGGQGVNTTDSRVQLSFDVRGSASIPDALKQRLLTRLDASLKDGCIVVTASEQRSQLQNREAAMRRLADIVRRGIAPPPKTRRPTKPSASAIDKRIREKRSRGETKRLRRSTDD